MRFRLIGVLAAMLMLAPAASFARTSTPVTQEAPAASTAQKPKKEKKAAKKKAAKKKTEKKSKKAKKPQS